MEERKITAETARKLFDTQTAIEEVAGMVSIMAAAFGSEDGEFNSKISAAALDGIGRSLRRISTDLSGILGEITEAELA